MENHIVKRLQEAFHVLKQIAREHHTVLKEEPTRRNAHMLAYKLMEQVRNIQIILDDIPNQDSKTTILEEISCLKQRISNQKEVLSTTKDPFI